MANGDAGTPSFPPPPPPPPPPSASGEKQLAQQNSGGAHRDPNARRGRRRWKLIGTLALAVGVLGAGGVLLLGRSSEESVVIRGTFMLNDFDGVVGEWDDCSGSGGYSDFGPGQFVNVADEKGDTIGGGRTERLSSADAAILEANNAATEFWDDNETDGAEILDQLEAFEDFACVLKFEFKTEKSKFYRIEIGRRGEGTYSHEDLEKEKFFVNLSLGD